MSGLTDFEINNHPSASPDSLPAFDFRLAMSCGDEQSKAMFDYFADQVDNHIQTALVSELMVRYAEVSKLLEEQNRALMKSEASRKEAQVIAQLGNWEVDVPTGAIWWSDTMYEIMEMDPATKPDPDTFMSIIHADDREKVAKILDDLAKGVASADQRYRLVMPDGSVKWIHARYRSIVDERGNPVSVHGTFQDITESVLIEEKLKKYSEQLEELVQEKVDEISASQVATIHALVKSAEARDDDTGDHIERTSGYCRLLASELLEKGLYTDVVNEGFIENMAKASPLHDIGKVGIPDAILLKPAKLDHDEFEIMKTHVLIGYDTLASVEKMYPENEFLKFGMEIAKYHHEKWNGSGYMDGLRGEEIPLPARIMALSDVYDALRSKRVYKDGFSHEKAVEIIKEGRGAHFDPALTDVFLENHAAFAEIFDRLSA